MSISTVQQAPSLPSEKYPRTELPSKRSGSILVVDDEAGIRNFLHRALIKEYGLVEVAESVETAEERTLLDRARRLLNARNPHPTDVRGPLSQRKLDLEQSIRLLGQELEHAGWTE